MTFETAICLVDDKNTNQHRQHQKYANVDE